MGREWKVESCGALCGGFLRIEAARVSATQTLRERRETRRKKRDKTVRQDRKLNIYYCSLSTFHFPLSTA
jgi:hypothetical protein